MAKLLAAAPDSFRSVIAIQAFAGLRSAEVMRLDWRDVKLDRDHIEITARNAKTAQRRLAPIWAQLRPGASDAAAGGGPALEKIIGAIQRRCKKARIIVRGDSAFAREVIMARCESQPRVVYYCLGLAGNARLLEMIPATLAAARARRCLTGAASARAFADLE